MNINPAELKVGQIVRVHKSIIDRLPNEMIGRIVSIDPTMVRVELKQNDKRSETYSFRPEQIVDVIA